MTETKDHNKLLIALKNSFVWQWTSSVMFYSLCWYFLFRFMLSYVQDTIEKMSREDKALLADPAVQSLVRDANFLETLLVTHSNSGPSEISDLLNDLLLGAIDTVRNNLKEISRMGNEEKGEERKEKWDEEKGKWGKGKLGERRGDGQLNLVYNIRSFHVIQAIHANSKHSPHTSDGEYVGLPLIFCDFCYLSIATKKKTSIKKKQMHHCYLFISYPFTFADIKHVFIHHL